MIIASGPYATDDNRSPESTGRAMSFRIRSWTTVELPAEGAGTARRTRCAARADVERSLSASSEATTSRGPSVWNRDMGANRASEKV